MIRLITYLLIVFGLAACAPPVKAVPTSTPIPPAPTLEATATLTPVILPSPTVSTLGVLQGKVIVGPLTPVVRLGTPTAVPPAETYTSRGIYIFLEDGKTALQKVMFLGDGTYRVELAPGKYVIDYISTGIDRAKNLPRPVVIEKGKITQLDLDIDTGIR